MTFLSTWNILGIVAIISLIIFFAKGKNAIWGGLAIGIFAGLIIALVKLTGGKEFEWLIVKKAVIIGTLTGVISEVLFKLTRRKTINQREIERRIKKELDEKYNITTKD